MTRPASGGIAAPVSAVALLLGTVRLFKRVVTVISNRRQVMTLRELDDRALKDIGLSRAEVEGALALPLHRDPSRVLAGHAGRARSRVPGRRDAAAESGRPGLRESALPQQA
jgi:uncharacterized protein YjiS (DUF1127 family)